MTKQPQVLVKRLAGLGLATVVAAAAQAASPGGIGGLSLQLEADAGLIRDGNNVVTWLDQSGQHHDASGVAGWFAQLSGATMNGIAVPTFSDSYLSIAGQPISSQQFTIFTVAATPQTAGSDGFREIVSNWSDANMLTSVFLGTVGYSAIPDTTLRLTDEVGGASDPLHLQTGVSHIANPAAGFVLTGFSGAGSAGLYLGQDLAHGAAALSPRVLTGAWVIGGQGEAGGEFWNGQIAAVLIYDRALDAGERTQVIDYLGQKYLGTAPVPEPERWALMLGGLGLLGTLVRRRRT
jgi:hypothetical protein